VQDGADRILHPDPYADSAFRVPPWMRAPDPGRGRALSRAALPARGR
jgi:hypothetical protein